MVGETEDENLRVFLQERYPGHDGWSPSDFTHHLGNVPGALLYASLFVPDFVEIEGCVFLKSLGVNPAGENFIQYAQKIREARSISAEALRALLSSCNWVEVAYLFANHGCLNNEDAILADLMARAWRSRLADRFPGRRFEVRVLGPDESGSVISVGFEEAPS